MRIFVISFISGIMGAALFTLIGQTPKKFGVVDINMIYRKHISDYGSLSIDEKKKLKKSGIFAESLGKAISKIATKNGVLMFVSGAIISDSPDFTDDVILEMNKKE